jgi:hypothetical protein
MGQPVVHFEIIGKNPEQLRSYYGDLFGWQFDTSAPVATAVSEAGNYGFVDRITTYMAFSKQFEVNYSSVFRILPRCFFGLLGSLCRPGEPAARHALMASLDNKS